MIRGEPGVAKYALLADLLRRQIEDGTYRPGAMLPSGPRMSEMYGYTRVTVTKAISLLRADGLVESRSGYGTWVRESDPDEDLAEVRIQRGAVFRVRPPTRAERIDLGIAEGGRVLEERLGARVRVYAADDTLFRIA